MTAASLSWLPERLLRENFDHTDLLESAAYAVFQSDWRSHPRFRGDEVRVHRHPHKANASRWHTYWHCVTEGQPEEARKTPMEDRLERIPWTHPVVVNEVDGSIKVWSNIRGQDRHVCIWLERENYLVVLKMAHNHFVLKTAYCPEPNRRKQLHKDYAAWKKTGRAL